MYSRFLKTFIAAADAGSFSKASQAVYLTPPAVMKEINALEAELGVKLLERNHSGIRLTEAGAIIYKDAKFIIDYAEKSIREAKAAGMKSDKVFSVGTSFLNPAKSFMDLWYMVSSQFMDYKLHLVPFDDDNENILSVIDKVGLSFDFLIGVCDSALWLEKARFLKLGTYKKMISVSRSHRLAGKDMLTYEDMEGETLIMVAEGDSPANDQIRADIKASYKGIAIEDASHFYDLSVFNMAASSDKMLLTTECWKDVHPELVAIPVDWPYEIPYGLIYSLNPSKDAERFVDAVKHLKL